MLGQCPCLVYTNINICLTSLFTRYEFCRKKVGKKERCLVRKTFEGSDLAACMPDWPIYMIQFLQKV